MTLKQGGLASSVEAFPCTTTLCIYIHIYVTLLKKKKKPKIAYINDLRKASLKIWSWSSPVQFTLQAHSSAQSSADTFTPSNCSWRHSLLSPSTEGSITMAGVLYIDTSFAKITVKPVHPTFGAEVEVPDWKNVDDDTVREISRAANKVRHIAP